MITAAAAAVIIRVERAMHDWGTMEVHELMSHHVVTCHASDTLADTVRVMCDHDVGAVPVVRDDGVLVGMITDRDICIAAWSRGRNFGEIIVADAMTDHPIAVTTRSRVGDVEQRMMRHQVFRLPVVDDQGRPIGIVTLNDLAREAVQSKTPLVNGLSRVTHVLAAIAQPRARDKAA